MILVNSLVITFMGLLGAVMAEACSCIELPPLEKAYENAVAIFSGEVSQIESIDFGDGKTLNVVLFEVQERFKGPSIKKVITSIHDGVCKYPFRKGEEYLAWVHREPFFGYTVLVCQNRTALLDESQAQEDIKWLRARPSL